MEKIINFEGLLVYIYIINY